MAEFDRTVQQIVDIVLTNLRSATGQTAKLFGQTLTEFNQALQVLTSLYRWNWNRREATINLVLNDRLVGLPPDCYAIEKANTNVNGRAVVLSELSQDEAKVQFPANGQTGAPTAYCMGIFNVTDTANPPIRQMRILPTSDGAYTIELLYNGTIKLYDTANYSEVPPIPQYVLPCLMELTKARMLDFTKAPAVEVQRAEINFEKLLKRAQAMDQGYNRKTASMRLNTPLSNYRSMRYST